MTDFVEVLKKQVESERRTRPSTPMTSDGTKISKKVLVPLEEPEEIDSSPQETQNKVDTEVATEVKFTVKEPTEKKKNPRSTIKAEMSTQATQEEEPKPKGGALWGPPPNEQELRKSYVDAIKEMRKKEAPSLMEIAMMPPPEPLKPTLETYFDRLMFKN